MTVNQRPSSFEMKLTIARDECPSVFEALSLIRDAKHRAHRLRELASKGLLLETHGFAIRSSAGIDQYLPTQGPVEATPQSAAVTTVGDSLDWDSDAT